MAAKKLYASVTNTSNILTVSYSDSHVAPTSTAIITAVSTTLDIGDEIDVFIGYVGENFKCLTGFVKNIERKEAERFYTITASNVLVRAIDFFIASSNPEEPFSRQNITAEDLIQDLLELSGLTDFDFENTSFTFAINNPVEVNLTGCFDYCKFLANVIAYTLYADNDGVVRLINRRPYVMGGDTPAYTFSNSKILEVSYEKSDHDLRNKVIVYGSAGIHEEASEPSPYLPDDYYRTVVVAAPGVIDSSGMASQAAEYNLELFNRLTEKVSVSMEGTIDVIPRTVATITSAGVGVSGDWYVYAVEHNWSKAGYITNVELRK